MPNSRSRRPLAAAVLLTSWLTATIHAAPPADEPNVAPRPENAAALALTPDTLDSWRTFILPDEQELRWKDVPWRASFWQAVLDAQATRKPVLLWVMNGHPMGCT